MMMFGKQVGRTRHGVSRQVQDWVDDGMGLIRDGAKKPMMWGALSVALAALAGFVAYRKQEPDSNGAKTPRRAAAHKRLKAAARRIGAKKKSAARHTSAG